MRNVNVYFFYYFSEIDAKQNLPQFTILLIKYNSFKASGLQNLQVRLYGQGTREIKSAAIDPIRRDLHE